MSNAADRSRRRRTEIPSSSSAVNRSLTTRFLYCVLFDRLTEMVAKIVFLEMRHELVENDFFKDLRQEWKIRNWTIVFEKVFVERRFF